MTTALELAKRCAGFLPVHITLVSQQNFFLFTPMLAEAATGAVETRHIVYPIRPLCGKWGIEFGEMAVESIDLALRQVAVRHRRSPMQQVVHYDKLVLALGAAPNMGAVKGASQYGLPFKGIGDAIMLRNHVIDCFEAAALTDDPWIRRRLLTFVVVGAGHAGTELVAAIEEMTRGILMRHYPWISLDNIRLVLVGSAVLPQTATHLATYTREQLLGRGIELEATRAAEVTSEGLKLQDGMFIPSHSVIWTAGNRMSPVVADLPLEKLDDGRLKVNEFFEVGGMPDVYALGDNAALVDAHTGSPYVATAQVAVPQAVSLAAVIEADLTGREKQPFHFRVLGELVPLSRRTAVADLIGIKLVGFIAWLIWKALYLLKLPTLGARARVVMDWIVELFFERDVSELALTRAGDRGA